MFPAAPFQGPPGGADVDFGRGIPIKLRGKLCHRCLAAVGTVIKVKGIIGLIKALNRLQGDFDYVFAARPLQFFAAFVGRLGAVSLADADIIVMQA